MSVDTKDNEKTIQTEVPVKFKKIVEEIEKMSVVELNELVKVLSALVVTKTNVLPFGVKKVKKLNGDVDFVF